MRFAVLIITPPQYPHSEATREVAESIHYGLLSIGHESVLTTSLDLSGYQPIILCSNLLPHYPVELPSHSILYNLEQVSPESTWFQPQLMDLFRQYPVWDYSLQNIAQLKSLGISHVQHLPIGYVPQLTRIPPAEEDIDVLFFGSLNDRRRQILWALMEQGVKTEVVFGVYGEERDRLIARSKIVLNLHYYEAKVFEVVRVSYLLANRRFVISERGSASIEEVEFAAGVVFAHYEELVDTCLTYLANPGERQQIAEAGFALMRQRDMATYLTQVLS